MSTVSGDVATNTAFFRRLPLFEGLADADIEQVALLARRIRFAAGHVIMQEGTAGDGLYIIASGQVEVRRRERGRDVPLALRGPGEFLGELSLLGHVPRTATIVAVEDSDFLVVEPADFHALLARCPPVMRTVLGTVAERVRSTESLLMEREKLASLGTMAAGLAHELNNPAAAVVRAAAHLRDVLARLQRATMEVGALALPPAQARRLDELADEAGSCMPTTADPLSCSAAEESLTEWLEEHDVPEAWDVAAPLVAFGWTRERFSELDALFPPQQLAAIAQWIAMRVAARGLVDEIDRSAHAMSTIVGAVRSYSYLDQAPVQQVDLADSLENTLIILRHRLRQGVAVVRDYEPDLPRIEAWGSELSQVWTNLIGNAVEAMDGRGTITIRARRRHDEVTVEIIDDGPGIPADVRPRIFEPFFTTRPPGVGSGLGLHIVWNIIVDRHRGRIHVDSEPGCTRFCVTLPVLLHPGAA